MNSTSKLTTTVFCALVTAVFLFSPSLQPVQAATVALFQDWERDPVNPNGDRLTTSAVWDDASVASVGSTSILVERFNLVHLLNDVSQSAETAAFTGPPNLLVEGNIFALYVDGVFSEILGVDQGGGAQISMRNFTTGGITSTINLFGDEIFRNLGGGNSIQYTLLASRFGGVSAVPLPAALPLFAWGLVLLGLFGWRRERKASSVTA